jgi:hypothetical protein
MANQLQDRQMQQKQSAMLQRILMQFNVGDNAATNVLPEGLVFPLKTVEEVADAELKLADASVQSYGNLICCSNHCCNFNVLNSCFSA